MYALSDGYSYRIIAFSSEEKAKQVQEELKYLDDNVYYYPPKDLLFHYADIQGKYLQKQRLEVVQAVMEHKAEESLTVVTTIDAFLDGLPSTDVIKRKAILITTEDSIVLTEISKRLVHSGYTREYQVEEPGQFAVRGGILDIYPLTEELPIRIELWGDEIDSIRTFDTESQRSVESLSDILIYPAENKEMLSSYVSFLDYFPKEQSILMLDDPIRLSERLVEAEGEYKRSLKDEELYRLGQGDLSLHESYEDPGFEADKSSYGEAIHKDNLVVFPIRSIFQKVNTYSGIAFSALETKSKDFHIRHMYGLHCQSVSPYHNSFEMLTRDLKQYKRKGYRVVLVSGSVSRAKRLAEDLRDYSLNSFYSADTERLVTEGEILVTSGHIEQGYEYPMLKFLVIAESDIFGRKKKKKKRRKQEGKKIADFADLRFGDYVVHESHGLGIYQGIEKIEVDGIIKDYMKITYAGSGVLYIPATQLDLIQKYADADAKKPKLNKLGGTQWTKTKAQVQKAVNVIAQDLVELYAKRQNSDGYCFEPDTVWQQEFEEMFPFEETEDQVHAIEDTKKDMESHKIMDRLICGDVGYGKTEIAIRAAFKSVQENKQVVYLVPTTILAQQHYNTFVQRMRDFPVRVDLMCRFRSKPQIEKTIDDLEKGLVDIVIGTHRVLSKDVRFKDLGLLIIDEEQRFGVTHKEKIKKLRENVDVLTMTATPIPRTLHMSLIGIRDMSVLEEAPMDRLPIQTYVMEYQEGMVKEAIERELSRGGQVYYVYNKAVDIADVASRIQRLVPEAHVSYAHGKMGERQLENIMYDFIQGEVDVLVSTTIVETGLDISNANTIIIHDADRFGLSQLYQLRGRVGRSNRMAYAFLLYRRDKMLREVAEKRLSAIREYTDLGSGIKIAMRDLEIRGAGNLLGEAQSGHMSLVGYDLYCKMLGEAVREAKGEVVEETYATSIDLNVDAYIPPGYIANEYQKLDVYKRIAAISNEDDMDDMLEELIDRFGDIPKKVHQLLQISLLRGMANTAYVTQVEQVGYDLKFRMFERAKIEPSRIPALLASNKGRLEFKADQPPFFLYKHRGSANKIKDEDILESVKVVLEELKGLVE